MIYSYIVNKEGRAHATCSGSVKIIETGRFESKEEACILLEYTIGLAGPFVIPTFSLLYH